MSQKWIRSKRWDDDYIPGWAWPAKFVLRAFSSIWLAVILLVLVCIYGTLASVPIGILAKAPTVVLIALTLIGALIIGAAMPTLLLLRAMPRSAGRGGRFAAGFLAGLALAVLTTWLWAETAWPRLKWNPATGGGFMLFSDFVLRYRGTTLRRLPGMEMSELEFYSWWPLRVVLLAFVVNMVVATVRRIEFTFQNIGVLTVHTGIVTIALGSIYYAAGKQEGDMILLAGQPDARGRMTPGPSVNGFYDNTAVALWVGPGRGAGLLEPRPIRHLPRYNDYNLNALGIAEDALRAEAAEHDRGRTLDIPVRPITTRRGERMSPIDADWRFNIVGYASYAELERRWVPSSVAPVADLPTPMRRLEIVSSLHSGTGEMEPVWATRVIPDRPTERLRQLGQTVQVEYTREMTAARWDELRSRLPGHVTHALSIEVPGAGAGAGGERRVYAAAKGSRIEVGRTGYVVEVQDLLPTPPFPIITRGYENAESSVAVVRVTPPSGAPFTRYVYHRYPEIGQDMLEGAGSDGRPARRDMDPAIRIGYIDASVAQIYLDELPADPGAISSPERAVRAIVRIPGHDAAVIDRAERGGLVPIAPAGEQNPQVAVRIGERWPHAASLEVPRVVPEAQRDNRRVGVHQAAAIAVRVSLEGDPTGWSQTFWVPFTQYRHIDSSLARTVRSPDGREVTMFFGRGYHRLPGMELQLVDFQMFPYPHSDVPQDYRSDLRVLTMWDGQPREEIRSTSLNAPLQIRVPFQPRPDIPAYANVVGRIFTMIAPNQYKFSQSGWDSGGWQESKPLVEQGLIERPAARFTILGVGNNPGIYIIAAGSVMMCVGIPWAFYLKPWLVRRKKRTIQAQIAAGAIARPPGAPAPPPVAARPQAPVPTRDSAPAGAERP